MIVLKHKGSIIVYPGPKYPGKISDHTRKENIIKNMKCTGPNARFDLNPHGGDV